MPEKNLLFNEERADEAGRSCVEIIYADGEKRIYRLSDADLPSYELLGKAEGDDGMTCLYFATKYCQDFKSLAAGYQVYKPEDSTYAIGMKFYKKKAN